MSRLDYMYSRAFELLIQILPNSMTYCTLHDYIHVAEIIKRHQPKRWINTFKNTETEEKGVLYLSE